MFTIISLLTSAFSAAFVRTPSSGAAMVSEEISERAPIVGLPKQPRRASSCERPRVRVAVQDRRRATWRWQDELELNRSDTRYRERSVNGCDYLRWLKGRWSERADQHWRLFARLKDPTEAIRFVFGEYAGEALKVVECESGGSTRAHNGQYLGLFQMGSSERARYGHGETPLEQARAAYRYFVTSGRDWSPWQCRPWGLGW